MGPCAGRGGCLSGDERGDGFGDMLGDVLGCALLRRAADFADEEDRFSTGIFLKHLE